MGVCDLIKMTINCEIEHELEKLLVLHEYMNLEEYIISVLKKEILSNQMRVLLPRLFESLATVKTGTVFKVTDLLEINLTDLFFTDIVQEVDYMFELYLSKSNQTEDYMILLFDEQAFMNTYLKL